MRTHERCTRMVYRIRLSKRMPDLSVLVRLKERNLENGQENLTDMRQMPNIPRRIHRILGLHENPLPCTDMPR